MVQYQINAKIKAYLQIRVMHPFFNVHSYKALRKAELSDFCIFTKFETLNIPYFRKYGIYHAKIVSCENFEKT